MLKALAYKRERESMKQPKLLSLSFLFGMFVFTAVLIGVVVTVFFSQFFRSSDPDR